MICVIENRILFILRRYAGILGVLFFYCFSMVMAENRSVIISKKIKHPPTIDGKNNDACWKKAEKTKPFTVLTTENPEVPGEMLKAEDKFLKNASTVQVCHDDKNIYFFFENPVPSGVALKFKKRNRDTKIWHDDCVELFLDPLKKMRFFQVVVNPLGCFFDAENEPSRAYSQVKWDSGAKIKTARDKKTYRVEIAVPFASFGYPNHSSGSIWGVNFTRSGESCGGLSTWANVGRDFHSVEKFGTMIFESRSAYLLKKLNILENKLKNLKKGRWENKQAKTIQADIVRFKRQVKAIGEESRYFVKLTADLDEIDRQINQLALGGKKYIIWEKNIWGPVSPDEKIQPDTKEIKELNIFSAQNTYNSTGFLVSNLSAKPLMGRFICTTNDSNGFLDAKTLQPSRIEFNRALYIELDSKLMVPDAITALGPFNLLEVPPHTTVLVWLEIDTHNILAGKYKQVIVFKPSYSGFKQKMVNISLNVAPVDLGSVKVRQFSYLRDPRKSLSYKTVKTLVKHGVNTIYAVLGTGRLYPKLDKKGNIIEFNVSEYDSMINNMIKTGVRKENISFCFWMSMKSGYRNLNYDGKPQLKYGSAEWENGLGNSLKAIRNYLFKQGFSYNDFVFYPVDEPQGKMNDPKTGTYKAFKIAEIIKKTDPGLLIMANMGLNSRIDKKQLPEYIKRFDVLEPYRPNIDNDASLIALLRKSGREIWTYNILNKSSAPTAYRNMSWLNLRDGFTGTTPFWCLDHFSGDCFNSYDTSPGKKRLTTDYGTCYPAESGEYMPSRRLKAWYQGNQDYKAVLLLKKRISELKAEGKPVLGYEKSMNKIILEGVKHTSPEMQKAREKIIKILSEIGNVRLKMHKKDLE